MNAKKPVYLLDDTLAVCVFYERSDRDLEDNICLVVTESCPEDEKIFKHDESHLYLTHSQAENLAYALLDAVKISSQSG